MKNTINALVVDDEVYAVEGILRGVLWTDLGINQTFSAHSMRQAIEVMEQYPIDIILCDIEMPKGSGLELFEWALCNNPGLVCIFLTSHANFIYAKKALQLGSIDYILKPIPYDQLTSSLQKAVKTAKDKKRQATVYEHATYWDAGKNQLLELLVADVALCHLPSNRKRILQEICRRHLSENWLGECFTPALLEFLYTPESRKRDTVLHEYGLRNMLNELIGSEDTGLLLSRLDTDLYLLLLPPQENARHYTSAARSACAKNTMISKKSWYNACQEIVDICAPVLGCDMNCYLGQPVFIEQLHREIERLKNMRLNNLSRNMMIEHPIGSSLVDEKLLTYPQLKKWERFYGLEQIRKAEEEIDHDMKQLAHNKSIDSAFLKRVLQIIEHGLNQMLERRNVPPERLFGGKQYTEMAYQATKSVQGIIIWLHYITNKAEDILDLRDSHPEAIEQAKYYILSHLNEPLTRNEIASAVYFSPDYLSHLFKLETGYTLSEYIMQQRILQAQKLLCDTKMPVYHIALAVGYDNLSYFSKLFRRFTDFTPTQYRMANT